MPTNVLSDTKCKAAKPKEKPYKLFDGHGMYLFVAPTGSKHWRMTYRLGGKAQTNSLGPYPLLSLADAREKRDVFRLALLNGEPIKAPKKKQDITLQKACEEYWAGRLDLSASYKMNATNGLAKYIYPKIGGDVIRTVDRSMVLEALKVMEAAGRLVYVRRVRMWLSQVFDWAIENEHADTNPCAAINPKKAFAKAKVVSFAALELPQVRAFMERLDMEGLIQSAQACRLLALTGVRTKELRMMRFDEVDGDLWRIPKARMKKENDHLVPLSRQAIVIIANMRQRSTGSEYVFPNDRRLDRPMSENAVLYLMGRMGYGKVMTGHGWRTVLSTWANEAGYSADAIERQLSHVPEDKTRGVYNRAEYLPERRLMMQAWADWLMPDTSS
ncbi:MAG: integrase arm-type DNA-binding domain-containing protein [Rhodoferax sp.]